MKNIAEYPNARELAKKLLEVFSKLKGNSKSFQPMGKGKREVIVLDRVSTVSRKGNKMDVITWQEIGTGRKTITYTTHNKHLEMANLQRCEPGSTWYVAHVVNKGFSTIKVLDELEVDPSVDPYFVPTEPTSKQTIMIFDIEVFMYDNLLVFKDYFTKEKFEIENDLDALRKFYLEYRDSLFVGYNSASYDNTIMRAIIQGENPYPISKEITENHSKNVYNMFDNKNTPLFGIDLYHDNKGFSLKEHCGFNGLDIRETEVDFDIDRPLTREERRKNRKYCGNDVDGTELRFEQMIDMLLAKASIALYFDLDKMALLKTNANLTATILGATGNAPRADEFEPYTLDTRFDVKTPEVLEALTGREFEKNDKGRATVKLEFQRRDLLEVIGAGGIHGAQQGLIYIGRFYGDDVGSEYPNTMLNFDLLSRAIPDELVHRYSLLVEERMKAKYSGEKTIVIKGVELPTWVMINGYKLPLNTKYGAMGAEFNKLFDPRMRLMVCITGQLAMVDLLEKIEPHGEILQSNTDAHYYIPNSPEDEKIILEKEKDWMERTGFTLDHDPFNALYQPNVNNYIAVDAKGKVKIKGAVGLTGGMKKSKVIVSNAFINYVINGKDFCDYIDECDDIRSFQIITKTGYKFTETVMIDKDGNETKAQKVNRIFAVKDPSKAIELYKVKRANDPRYAEDWLDDDELEEGTVKKINGDRYTVGLGKAPEYYTISNEACGEGITLDEIDREYYKREVVDLLRLWFGPNWNERLEEAHIKYEECGFDKLEVKEYIS